LLSGDVSVTVERSEFKKAEFNVAGEADIKIPNTNGLKLGGTLQGKYENDSLDLDGELTLTSDLEYSQGWTTTRILAGELARVRIRATDITADLAGASLESTIQRRSAPLVFGGTVESGTVRNGQLDLKARTELQSPVVLASHGRFKLVLADADLDLSIVDGRRAKFHLSHLRLAIRR
jgi:hypothetical protein